MTSHLSFPIDFPRQKVSFLRVHDHFNCKPFEPLLLMRKMRWSHISRYFAHVRFPHPHIHLVWECNLRHLQKLFLENPLPLCVASWPAKKKKMYECVLDEAWGQDGWVWGKYSAILIQQTWSIRIYYTAKTKSFLAGQNGRSRVGKLGQPIET